MRLTTERWADTAASLSGCEGGCNCSQPGGPEQCCEKCEGPKPPCNPSPPGATGAMDEFSYVPLGD